jgi:hypothetical protein
VANRFGDAALLPNRLANGPKGRALYQADFYLREAGKAYPNTALMAVVVEGTGPTNSYKLYRFGVSEGGKKVYFAYANDDLAAAGTPIVYHHQSLDEFPLKRPGWHRLQMIFDGTGSITCAVDMVPTKFSPIQEATLQRLNAGVMIASSTWKNRAFVDNISIQWSFDDVPLPKSPWATKSEAKHAATGVASLLDEGNGVSWRTDPQAAWKESAQRGIPRLVNFHAPGTGPADYLRGLLPNTPVNRTLLERFVCLNLDVNQLDGGTFANRFRINRVPTLVVIGTAGREVGRMVVSRDQTTAADVVKFLEGDGGSPAQ